MFVSLKSQTGKLIYSIKAPLDFFTTDNLGNAYVILGEEIVKYGPNGTLINKFSNKLYGNITGVDATNPLKILLYYKNFQQIVFVDNQLSQNGQMISLENLNHEQTELVCTSFNNSFWIYDKQNNELTRFNEQSQPVSKTGNLKQILEVNLKPNFMIEHGSYLYLSCPDFGIYVFDIYGTFIKIISLKNLSSFQVNNQTIYYYKNNKLFSYNSKTFEEFTQDFNDALIKHIRLEKDKIYLQYSDSLKVFVNSSK